MAGGATDFSMLNNEKLTRWVLDFYRAWRDQSFLMNAGMIGTGNGSMIQRIKELSSTTDGARAVITLVRDPTGDGVVGDNQLESNEELMRAANQVIQLDQMRNAHLSVGEMALQASVVKFRREARDSLSFWLADRFDQLAFLTMSGIAYTKTNNGATRVGSQFPLLKFAADVTAPSTRRYTRWDAALGLQTYLSAAPPANTDLVAADKPSWQMLVDLKAYAVDNAIRPMRGENGIIGYNVFMSGKGIAALKKDPDFLDILKNAEKRGDGNPLFKGTNRGGQSAFHVDGMNVMEFKHVYNTTGAPSGQKWGDGTVDGQRVLLCGAQALAFADIGKPKWVEKKFDYDNRDGIAIGKILGFKKPVFPDQVSGSLEDFAIVACDTSL